MGFFFYGFSMLVDLASVNDVASWMTSGLTG